MKGIAIVNPMFIIPLIIGIVIGLWIVAPMFQPDDLTISKRSAEIICKDYGFTEGKKIFRDIENGKSVLCITCITPTTAEVFCTE